MNSKTKWLEIAYYTFAEYGPKGLAINRLANDAGLTRSNFYYHFSNKDDLIKQLLDLHEQSVEEYLKILKAEMINFLPDLHVIIMRHTVGLKFHRQLFLNQIEPLFGNTYRDLNKKANPLIIPKLLSYYKFEIPYSFAENLWIAVLDTWYSRLDINQLSVAYMCQLTESIMKTVFRFSRDYDSDRNI